MELNEVVIVSAVRTPIGSFQGALKWSSRNEAWKRRDCRGVEKGQFKRGGR